jgi:Fe-S-cluster containining protein
MLTHATDAAEPGSQEHRKQRWSDLALETLCEEYIRTSMDAKAGIDSVDLTRRHYRRFALVQQRTLETEVAQNGDALACRKGCGYCCHNRVSAPAHEILTLAACIQELPEAERAVIVERVARNAERIGPMTSHEQFTTPIRCALLGEDASCSVYEARPTACRRYHSQSLEDCETSFFDPENLESRIRLSIPLLAMSSAHSMGLRRALAERELDATHYELHTALREAMVNPQVCADRYRRGEKTFLYAKSYGQDRTDADPGNP